MKKIDLRKGSGEFVALSVVAPMICSIIIMLCAFVQISINVHQLTNATNVAGRSVAICSSFEDAQEQSVRVAQSAITSPDIYNIQTIVEYANADTEWESGTLIKVTVLADIKTVAPFVASGTRKKTTIVSVEGSIQNDDLNLLAATIATESSASTVEGMTAVGTVIMNRVESSLFPNNIHDVVYQPGQFEVTWASSNFQNYIQNGAPDAAIECARDILNGTRTPILMQHNCVSFRAHRSNGHNYENDFPTGVDIAGNWFFW